MNFLFGHLSLLLLITIMTGSFHAADIEITETQFTGDKSTASWLLNAAFAADWQTFQRDGQLAK